LVAAQGRGRLRSAHLAISGTRNGAPALYSQNDIADAPLDRDTFAIDRVNAGRSVRHALQRDHVVDFGDHLHQKATHRRNSMPGLAAAASIQWLKQAGKIAT